MRRIRSIDIDNDVNQPGDKGNHLCLVCRPERLLTTAAMTSDSNSPELTATMISPQLEPWRERTSSRLHHEVIERGGPTYFGKQEFGISAGNQADVVSCVHGEEIEIDMRRASPYLESWAKRLRTDEFGDA